MVWYGMVWYDMFGMVWCGAVGWGGVWFGMVWYECRGDSFAWCVAMGCVAQCSAIVCLVHYDVQY